MVRIVPIVSAGRSYAEKLPGRSDDWDDLDRLDRIDFYADDRDDRVNFKATIWKRSHMTETIETIDSCPRNHNFYFSNREEIRPGRC